MAWLPIALHVPQYTSNGAAASGFVLKAYQASTSTNIPFATDSGGGTQVTSIALNADGFPEVSGNVVIPHIDQTFKLSLYPTQAAADANSGADWTIDGLTPISNVAFGNTVNEQTVTYTLQAADKGALIHFTGAGGVTLNLIAAADAGDGFAFLVENDTSGTVTIDGDGAEQVNGATTFVIPAGAFAIVDCNGTAWRALIAVTGDSTETLTNKTLTDPTVTDGTFTDPEINNATGIGQSIVKRKTADDSVTSSETLQDDDHLLFAIGASEEWVADFNLTVGDDFQASGMKVSITVPTGATLLMDFSGAGNVVGEAEHNTSTTSGGTLSFGNIQFATSVTARITGHVWVLNSTNAGNVTLQWAQVGSNATALTVKKGSNLVAHRIA